MKVHLAGYNVDTEVLNELQNITGKRSELTPEVISAAYARISRDPRSIEEIRKDARQEVERSRKSNQTIIFKMGHHSVAEHAVFNLDVVGISRYAMEELEKFRLSSFTEKSQRYITLNKDFVIPQEVIGTALEKDFVEIIEIQNKAYSEYFEKLKEYVFKKHFELAQDPKNHNLLEGWAKEDARYITALATESQAGLTVNARNLELMLRRFASNPLEEVRSMGRAIYEQIVEVAPSIVIFHQANDKDLKTYPDLRKTVSKLIKTKNSEKNSEVNPVRDNGRFANRDGGIIPPSNSMISIRRQEPLAFSNGVKLVDYSKSGDDLIAAALIHTSSDLSFDKCLSAARKLPKKAKENIFKSAFYNLQFYDSVLREFEYANLTYNIILSSACFGQLKRHRMATITAQQYDTSLGITVPDSIKETGLEKHFREIISKTEVVYQKLRKISPIIVPYILTNSHRKRVLCRLNARELYHLSRLREDTHAQWDIQNIARSMSQQAKKVMPLTFMMVCGKDKYKEVYKNIFGKLPKVVKAELPGARKIK
ncbi:MAG: FAD-dependent thymidylate synthase [Elusimicrobia bacterium]|nr:FAD-dependent thymidylate synthase [Elusimicrobiota bacterium]